MSESTGAQDVHAKIMALLGNKPRTTENLNRASLAVAREGQGDAPPQFEDVLDAAANGTTPRGRRQARPTANALPMPPPAPPEEIANPSPPPQRAATSIEDQVDTWLRGASQPPGPPPTVAQPPAPPQLPASPAAPAFSYEPSASPQEATGSRGAPAIAASEVARLTAIDRPLPITQSPLEALNPGSRALGLGRSLINSIARSGARSQLPAPANVPQLSGPGVTPQVAGPAGVPRLTGPNSSPQVAGPPAQALITGPPGQAALSSPAQQSRIQAEMRKLLTSDRGNAGRQAGTRSQSDKAQGDAGRAANRARYATD